MDEDAVAESFRRWGYLQANLDPLLGRLAPVPVEELDRVPEEQARRWRAHYCRSIGAEFHHLSRRDQRVWIESRMEAPAADEVDPSQMLRRLAEAELFESFLGQRYVGNKRYSLEGMTSLVPLLQWVLDAAADGGSETAIVAMSHRGRLNVMTNVVGIPASRIFTGFEDVDRDSVLGGGDLRYHQGATGTRETARGRRIGVHLVSNPSHLEAVDPVAMGRARARQQRAGAEGARNVLPVTLHGDAAFAGQGTVAETLNLARLQDYTVGGTLHIIVDNLLGFTTPPSRLHSGRFATDLARGLELPVFHVNAQDPDAVVRAGLLALEFRTRFAGDVILDLIGYRRYGHSELDDPTTTQPVLYRRIEGLDMLWVTYGRDKGILDERQQEELQEEIEAGLSEELEKTRDGDEAPPLRRLPDYWRDYVGGPYDPGLEVSTGVSLPRLREIAHALVSVPEEFHLHPKVRKGLGRRAEMLEGERPVDWGMAEALAFGSLLRDGIPVRLSGEDSRRGTFNQRHSVVIDVENEQEEYVPLAHVHPEQAPFEAVDSPLSEAGALGFEYGFSRDMPEALVCWEAQFGDFADGAQAILDEFVCVAEDKWNLLSGLVLLLPHGYEGQGPEHSSARLERFLTLAAEDGMQICQPTTAAQYFHLLRRQVLRRWRKPLVIATPKGQLRSRASASSLEELRDGSFQPVLAPGGSGSEDDVERVLLCSGKVAHELASRASESPREPVAVIRLEQLYPFPRQELSTALQRFPGSADLVWVQEEPANMGALRYVRSLINSVVEPREVLAVSRAASASPATGSKRAHDKEQAALLDLALDRTSRENQSEQQNGEDHD